MDIQPSQAPQRQQSAGLQAVRSIGGLIKIIMLVSTSLFGLMFFIIGCAVTLMAVQAGSYTAETQATVIDLNKSTDYDQKTRQQHTSCTPSYTFVVNGKTYKGQSSIGSDTLCSAATNNMIAIRYDPTSPTKNSTDDPTNIWVGSIMLGFGLLIILAVIGVVIYSHRHGDKDGDGLKDDNMPATQAQITLIESGMRNLGEFWTPRKMTQSEAREIINNLDKKLQK